MKKLLLFASVLALAFTAQAKNEPISFDSMPDSAKIFTRAYFPESDPMFKQAYVSYDAEYEEDAPYMVVFTTGDGIQFRKTGEWKAFECAVCTVPDQIVPAKILEYIKAKYPQDAIQKIEKNRKDVDVYLKSGLGLRFDTEGNLL